jgi:hypothetical protein
MPGLFKFSFNKRTLSASSSMSRIQFEKRRTVELLLPTSLLTCLLTWESVMHPNCWASHPITSRASEIFLRCDGLFNSVSVISYLWHTLSAISCTVGRTGILSLPERHLFHEAVVAEKMGICTCTIKLRSRYFPKPLNTNPL